MLVGILDLHQTATAADMIQMPQKKALLVGICYEESDDTALLGPHKGVLKLKRVLIGKYHSACP